MCDRYFVGVYNGPSSTYLVKPAPTDAIWFLVRTSISNLLLLVVKILWPYYTVVTITLLVEEKRITGFSLMFHYNNAIDGWMGSYFTQGRHQWRPTRTSFPKSMWVRVVVWSIVIWEAREGGSCMQYACGSIASTLIGSITNSRGRDGKLCIRLGESGTVVHGHCESSRLTRTTWWATKRPDFKGTSSW